MQKVQHVGAGLVFHHPGIDEGADRDARRRIDGDLIEVVIFQPRGGFAFVEQGFDALGFLRGLRLLRGLRAALLGGGQLLIGFPIGQGFDEVAVVGELIGRRFRGSGDGLCRGRGGCITWNAPGLCLERVALSFRLAKFRGEDLNTRDVFRPRDG